MDFLTKVTNHFKGFVAECANNDLNQMTQHLLGGKMLRAKLLALIAGESDEAVILAAIIEMIHAASLLHDDVIDKSFTRRGKQSINAIFGDHTAIMFGDILYAKAFSKLVVYDTLIATKISDAVALLSIGEFLDVLFTKEIQQDREKYFEIITKKTASLIEATTFCAAILAKQNPEPYALYGRSLGIAFQMIDDILDITQDPKVLGKPSMQDFKEGKTTIPFIVLYEKLNDEDKNILKTLFAKDLSLQEQQWLLGKFAATNVIEEVLVQTKEIATKGLLSDSLHRSGELNAILLQTLQREF